MPGSDASPSVGLLARLLSRRRRDPRGSRDAVLQACFGPLEIAVLQALWQRQGSASVRMLAGEFPSTAYTTLMTTLDRLFKKGVLERHRAGRAFRYRPRCTRSELEAELARDAFDGWISGCAHPVLSGLVDAVGGRDAPLLDELERLVQEKRAEASRKRSATRGDR